MEHPDGELVELRRQLHRRAELSNHEVATAALVAQVLQRSRPARVIAGLGGHGLAAVFAGREPGPRVLLRCELDALPIAEAADLPHGSADAEVSHRCGHDGHMALMLGLAARLGEDGVQRGEVVLLFQPAEETGEGARRVLDDARFGDLVPHMAFALHNLPGHPLGRVIVRSGPFASASRGLVVKLRGEPAHASEPNLGRSPTTALARLVSGVEALPQRCSALGEAVQATVVHARLGRAARFGTSPGGAVVMATLRAHRQGGLERVWEEAARLARGLAHADGLDVEVTAAEDFPATVNHPAAAALVAASAEDTGLDIDEPNAPFPWSEDFGHFTARFPGALFGLGAGEDSPHLHSDCYDFPDGLLSPGLALLRTLVGRAQNADH